MRSLPSLAALLIALFFFPAPLRAQLNFWVPQMAHGTGFSTQINIVNLSAAQNQISVTVQTFDNDGDPANLIMFLPPLPALIPESLGEVEALVPGLGAARVVSLNFDPDDLDVGYARVISPTNVGVEVLFQRRDPLDGNRLVASTAVLIRPPTRQASFLATLSGTARTGLALLNPPTNGETAVVNLFVLDHGGVELGEVELLLLPGQKVSKFLDELIEDLPVFFGTVELRSSLFISVMPLRQEGSQLTAQDLFNPRPLNN